MPQHRRTGGILTPGLLVSLYKQKEKRNENVMSFHQQITTAQYSTDRTKYLTVVFVIRLLKVTMSRNLRALDNYAGGIEESYGLSPGSLYLDSVSSMHNQAKRMASRNSWESCGRTRRQYDTEEQEAYAQRVYDRQRREEAEEKDRALLSRYPPLPATTPHVAVSMDQVSFNRKQQSEEKAKAFLDGPVLKGIELPGVPEVDDRGLTWYSTKHDAFVVNKQDAYRAIKAGVWSPEGFDAIEVQTLLNVLSRRSNSTSGAAKPAHKEKAAHRPKGLDKPTTKVKSVPCTPRKQKLIIAFLN